MEDKRKMKKIQRIAKGDELIVEIIAEDLIDLFEKMNEAADDFGRSRMDCAEEPENVELWKKEAALECAYKKLHAEFWYRIRVQYDAFGPFDIKVCDGYSLVKTPLRGPQNLIQKIMGGGD